MQVLNVMTADGMDSNDHLNDCLVMFLLQILMTCSLGSLIRPIGLHALKVVLKYFTAVSGGPFVTMDLRMLTLESPAIVLVTGEC
jgi:hypothetical protein